jgi:NAD(P)-dependent dehydrogenase (short-subunit alcohol dehydrogenase family)
MSDAAPKIALVTGANKGIGLEIARALSRAGATVLIGARNAEAGEAAAAKLRGEGLDARFQAIDVTNAASINSAADRIARDWGRLDILVNNAAVSLDRDTVPSTANLDLFRQAYETNVFGLIAVTQAMTPLLRAAPAGRIVNMSSGLGSLKLTGGKGAPLSFSRHMAYNSSKTTVNAITVQFANEFLDKVNAANPGLCATEMTKGQGRPASEGAAVAVKLALLDDDGPTGGLFGDAGQLPW